MRRPKQENQRIPGCGFHHVAIRTSDWDRTMRLYEDGLGFHAALRWGEAPRRAVMLDSGDGNYLEVFERDPGPAGSERPAGAEDSILHFCLRVDDCDGAVARARAAGFEVTVEPKSIEISGSTLVPVRLAFIKGPSGEICEFFQNEIT